MGHRNVLVVFVKYPEPGKVKTRLGREIGLNNAAEVSKSMVLDVMENISGSESYDIALCYTPDNKKNEICEWLRKGSLVPQEGIDLGGKLINCFQHFLESYEKVVVIGSDCLTLDNSTIEESFRILGSRDVVLGPASDGGYYLVGLKKFHDLFSGISWSTERVLEETMGIIKKQNLSFGTLEEMNDVDDLNDLKKVDKKTAPKTYEAVEKFGLV